MNPGRSQHRSLILLAVALGVQVLLLAAQVRSDQDVRLIRVWAVELVAPLGRSATWVMDGIRGGWNNYIGLRGTSQENAELRAEVDRLKLRNAELEGRAAEADRLAGLLNFRQTHGEVPMLAARVIGASPSASGRIAFLDRGSRDGVDLDMGVITPEGVVGKVVAVYPATSQVLLLSDKESGVGALLAGSRTQGPVRGTGDPVLGMEYVSKEVKVTVGETVLTSGQDRIFPKDLPVGTVLEVRPDPRSPFQEILVQPSAHLDRLEEVLVLLTRQEFAAGPAADTRPASTGVTPPAPRKPTPTPTQVTPPAARPAPAPATPATAPATAAPAPPDPAPVPPGPTPTTAPAPVAPPPALAAPAPAPTTTTPAEENAPASAPPEPTPAPDPAATEQ
jgi:rod shape-determining protein MreC